MIHPPALHWHTTPFKVMMIGRRGSAALCRLNNASNFAECSRFATARRSFCISHTHAKAASSVQQQQAPTSTSKLSASSSSSTAIQDTSSCPAGTVLTGLNIYKDRADPVALPDKEYPAWLWTLLSDGKTSAEGAQLESTEGMTKGEARAAEKRNLRAIRAAFRAKERLAAQQQRTSTEHVGQMHVAGAGAGMHAAGKPSEGIVAGAPGLAEAQQAEAAGTVADAAALDADKKRQLRKANREAIKAKNFVKAS